MKMLHQIIGGIPNPWSHNQIHIITDGHDWVINEVSKSLADRLTKKNLARVAVSPFFSFLSGKVIHFNAVSVPKRFPRNKILATWYHVNDNDPRLGHMDEVASRIDLLHTTAQKTKTILTQHGFPEEKIHVVPMGIDLQMFAPASTEEKKAIRVSLGIPPNVFVIGSFQKDGDGWGAGMNPKWIKGPDIFCDVVERLAKHYPIHVLLSGPSRGYVIERLTRANIPFTHRFLNQYADVNTLYQAIDVYLIASRTEGVPMALLESWATGVPLVSTRVGMVQDVATHEKTALLAEIEDRDKLASHVSRVFEDQILRGQLQANSLIEIKKYSWNVLIDRYWNELYSPLLSSLQQ